MRKKISLCIHEVILSGTPVPADEKRQLLPVPSVRHVQRLPLRQQEKGNDILIWIEIFLKNRLIFQLNCLLL